MEVLSSSSLALNVGVAEEEEAAAQTACLFLFDLDLSLIANGFIVVSKTCSTDSSSIVSILDFVHCNSVAIPCQSIGKARIASIEMLPSETDS